MKVLPLKGTAASPPAAHGAPGSRLPFAPYLCLLPGLPGEESQKMCRDFGGRSNLPQGPDPARCPNSHRDEPLTPGESTKRRSYSVKWNRGKSQQRDLLQAATGTRRSHSRRSALQNRRGEDGQSPSHGGSAEKRDKSTHTHPAPSRTPTPCAQCSRSPGRHLPARGSAGAAAPGGLSAQTGGCRGGGRRSPGRPAARRLRSARCRRVRPERVSLSLWAFCFVCFSPPSDLPRQP